MPSVETSTQGEVRIIRINRPEAGNRIDTATSKALITALEGARCDRAIGACVLTGTGGTFCLGGEYWSAGPSVAARMEFARAFADLNNAISRLGKPLIAAVNGDAHAGGFSVVVACDMAVMAEDATLGLPEAEKGLFPFLALAIVKDALPKKLLFDIVYNARLMAAPEAIGFHLVNASCAKKKVLETAVEWASTFCRYNRDVVMLGRDLYYSTRCMGAYEALEASSVALGAAMSARDEASPGWNG